LRAVVQRVLTASVRVEQAIVGQIKQGFLVFIGVAKDDTLTDVSYIGDKIAGLRIFEDSQGKMNLSLKDIEGSVLLVSQFTLLGDARQGRRPGFSGAAEPAKAEDYYTLVKARLESLGIIVATGVFRADMLVSLENDGPVTILLDSKKTF
jgi:D-tyrosyl-tRNA(Tyr) deacylase